MTPIGIKLSLFGQKEVSDGLKKVGDDVNNLGNAGQQVGSLSQGMDKAALSAGQLKLATQQLPLQFQDIVVSLQAGQQPLTVLLQQGSQLAGSFGGAGAAAKAMLGYVAGMINPVTVLGASVAALGLAYYQGSKEQDAWIKGIVTTGNASGVTTSQLREYTRQIDGVVGTQAKAAAGLADFVQAGVRGGDELRRFTETAITWEKATGQAVSTTAKQFADLQKDPLDAVIKLNEGTNFLTVSVYEQIKALEGQGDKAGAAAVAMDALDSAMRDRAKDIEASLGYLERGWDAIARAAKKGWDAMLNVGRPATLEEQLADVEKKLKDARANQSWGETGGGAATGRVNAAYDKKVQDSIRALTAQKTALLDQIDAERLNAAAKAQSAEQMQAVLAFNNKYSKALESEVSLQDKLKSARAEAVAAGKTESEIKKVLAYVTEEHNKSLNKGANAAKLAKTSYEGLMSTINQKIVAMRGEVATGEKLTETEKLRAKLKEDLNTKDRKYSEQQRANLEAGLAALDVAEQQAIAARSLTKAYEDDAKALERLQQQREKQLDTLQGNLQKLQQEERAHAYAAAAGITHAEAVERLTIARLEEHLAMARQGTESQTTIDWLERELLVRQQIAEVMGQRGVREANEKAQEQLKRDWERTAQTIGDTLADYIMGGGKDAATYLKRLFSTLVLQPVVQTVVGGIMGTGSAAAAGGGSGLMSNLSSGQSIWSAFSGSLTAGVGGTIASLGATLGSSAATAFGSGIAAGGSLGLTAGLSQGASMIGAGAGGTAAGLGTMAGAALPWVAGAMALYSIAKSFDNSGTPHYGAGAIYQGGAVTGGADIYNLKTFGMGARGEWSANAQTSVSGIATALGASLDGFAKAFGKEAGYTVATAFADDSSGDGAWGSLRIADALGNVLTDWEQSRSSKWAPKTFADGEEGYKQYLNAVAGDVKSAFLSMDLPGWASNLIAAANDLDTLNAALMQIGTIKAVFDGLGQSMAMFKGISSDLQTQLLNTAGSMDALASNATAFYGAFYSEAQRMQAAREQINAALQGMGVSFGEWIDVFDGEAAKQAFKFHVEQAMSTGQGELAARLLAMSTSFAQAADYAAKSAEEAAKLAKQAYDSAVDRAMSQLEYSVGKERTYWSGIESAAQTAIGTISSAVQLLQSNARELYGTVDATSQLQAVQGMLYVENALSAVRGGASVQDFAGLQDAITAARGGINSGSYATAFERERDALVLAGQLSELGEFSEAQLTVEERTLRAAQSQIEQLDQTLDFWREQIDGTMAGIDVAMSIDQAVRQLIALQEQKTATAVVGVSRSAEQAASGAALYADVAAYGATHGSDAYYFIPGVNDVASKLAGYADLAAILGKTIDEVAKSVSGYDTSYWNAVDAASKAGSVVNASDSLEEILRKAGVPGYATGGLHAGGLRIVGERGPELEVTGPARYWDASKTMQMLGGSGGGNTERLERLVESLITEVQRVQAIVGEGNRASTQLLDITDQKSEGGSADRVRITNIQELAVAIKEVMA